MEHALAQVRHAAPAEGSGELLVRRRTFQAGTVHGESHKPVLFRLTLFWESGILIIKEVGARPLKIIEAIEAKGIVGRSRRRVTP